MFFSTLTFLNSLLSTFVAQLCVTAAAA